MALNLNSYYILKLKTFNIFTKEENELYDDIKKSCKDDRQKLRSKLNSCFMEYKGQREIKSSSLRDKNGNVRIKSLVSLFENNITRWIIQNRTEYLHPLYGNKRYLEGIIVLNVYKEHAGILQGIIKYGLRIEDKEYFFFTAGAGQQRNNEITLLERSVLEEYKSLYMCGLTNERINASGGINTGKYLAYLALPLSSSKPINIDIDKVIVVPDLEIVVDKDVEHIDVETFESKVTTLKDLGVKLNQTDGAGMILPSMLQRIEQQLGLDYLASGFQIRGSWIKGALFPFNFRRFCVIKGKSTVRDVYGIEHDIVQEDIQIILAASQFKTWGHYRDWEEYKDFFKANGLSFSATAISNPPKAISQMNYQFLQTLDRALATKEAITALSVNSVEHLEGLKRNKGTIFETFGAVKENPNLQPLQEALLLYPALLRDFGVEKQIGKIVRSTKNDYLAGHLRLHGFYGYAMPDMYGFCEYLFQGNERPAGIIPHSSVYCNHYHEDEDIRQVDCMRAPQLGNEHMIRQLLHSPECRKWFSDCGQNVIYSVQDILMLGLQGDCDGDMIFISPEKCLIDLVKDHTVLHYALEKGKTQEINDGNIYKTLINSFAINDNQSGRSIANISNAITKIWNSVSITEDDLELLKYLVMLNNYTIDYPKTGKHLALPDNIQAQYEALKSKTYPYFFKWAKGKNKHLGKANKSLMNLICQHIKDVPDYHRSYLSDIEEFDYSILQRRTANGEIWGVDRSSEKYKDIHKACVCFGKKICNLMREINNIRIEKKDINEYDFDLRYSICLDELFKICPEKVQLANILIDLHYNQSSIADMHNILWSCVGGVLVENIKANLNCEEYQPQCRKRKAYKMNGAITALDLKEMAEKRIEESIPVIYRNDIEWLNKVKSPKARQLLFTLLCFSKKNEDHKIYYTSNSKRLNKTKLAIASGLKPNENLGKLIKELIDLDLINEDYGKRKGRVIALLSYDWNRNKDDQEIIRIRNIYCPYIYYETLFNNKKINQCNICGQDFLAEGNKKTCSNNCSNILNNATKARNNDKKRITN